MLVLENYSNYEIRHSIQTVMFWTLCLQKLEETTLIKNILVPQTECDDRNLPVSKEVIETCYLFIFSVIF